MKIPSARLRCRGIVLLAKELLGFAVEPEGRQAVPSFLEGNWDDAFPTHHFRVSFAFALCDGEKDYILICRPRGWATGCRGGLGGGLRNECRLDIKRSRRGLLDGIRLSNRLSLNLVCDIGVSHKTKFWFGGHAPTPTQIIAAPSKGVADLRGTTGRLHGRLPYDFSIQNTTEKSTNTVHNLYGAEPSTPNHADDANHLGQDTCGVTQLLGGLRPEMLSCFGWGINPIFYNSACAYSGWVASHEPLPECSKDHECNEKGEQPPEPIGYLLDYGDCVLDEAGLFCGDQFGNQSEFVEATDLFSGDGVNIIPLSSSSHLAISAVNHLWVEFHQFCPEERIFGLPFRDSPETITFLGDNAPKGHFLRCEVAEATKKHKQKQQTNFRSRHFCLLSFYRSVKQQLAETHTYHP